MEKNLPSKQGGTKANALLCPSCCVEYVEVEFDFEVENVVLHNVKALKCPQRREEVFSPEQQKAIRTQVKDFPI